jgi:hypothetical protein
MEWNGEVKDGRDRVMNIFTPQIGGEHFCKNSIEEVSSLSSIHHFFRAIVKTLEQLVFIISLPLPLCHPL